MIVVYIVLLLIVLYAIGNLFTFLIQDVFIFRPSKLGSEYRFDFKTPHEELTVETPHQGKINCLWFRRKAEQRPVVYYHHGNSGDLSGWGHLSEFFDKLGFDFFIYDFRGFGKSTGKRSEKYFHSDALTLYNIIKDHYPAQQIVIYGRSMGSGPASKLAKEVDSAMLILETPYYSIRELFTSYYRFLPNKLFVFKYAFPNYKWISKTKAPVHIFHGDKDRVISLKNAIKLRPLLGKKDSFTIIKDGNHKNLGEFPEFIVGLEKLLTSVK